MSLWMEAMGIWSFFLGHYNELAVIASEAKQSILSLRGAMDCVVAALLAMTAVNAGAGALTLRAHGLDIVAVGIDQERGEIARAVIGPRAGAAIVAPSGLQ